MAVRRRKSQVELLTAALVLTVLAASLMQAMVEYGDNPRFGVPTQPLVLCYVVIFISLLWGKKNLVSRLHSLESTRNE